ncbi:hypothetical protein DCCM_0801 [Desulfocucumis palustris]|uniref:Uncharacterized protein n=1 Tax=Desulfocucumis palustris TaxID=1898651 RepID=A0A2L2X8U1_9FIRM|nr:hypothetical protein [Desulfocucumis palustris]GBF32605.1 hypothetical protein DCCM_0801 [Desulfocucumis palustris]
MSFPPVIKVVFAADGTGKIKALLDPKTAEYAVKKGRARKISDNLVQYKKVWKDVKPLDPSEIDNIILLGTVSIYTPKSGWLKADRSDIEKISEHNKKICREQLSKKN